MKANQASVEERLSLTNRENKIPSVIVTLTHDILLSSPLTALNFDGFISIYRHLVVTLNTKNR